MATAKLPARDSPQPEADTATRGEAVAAFARSERHWLLPAAVLFCWLVFLAFVLPIDPDEAVFKIVATGILDGRWPYRDLWDNKPPLIYLWYLPAGLGASLAVERFVAALAVVASIRPFSILAKRWLDGRSATLAIVCYCLLLANPVLAVRAHTEAFMLFPLVASLVVASPFVAGALLGIAVLTKPTALVFTPLLLFLHRGQSWRGLLGMICVSAVVVAPFLVIWRDAFTANVIFNIQFGQATSDAARLENLAYFNYGVLFGVLPVWLFVLLGLSVNRDPRVWLLALLGLLSIKATGLEYTHYYALLVPAGGLLAGVGVDTFLRPPASRAWRVSMRFIFVMSAVLSAYLCVFVVSHIIHTSDPYARLLDAISHESGEMYVLGGRTQLYALADRQPQRRFFFNIPIAVRDDWGRQQELDLERCPPAVLVIPRQSTFEVSWAGEIEALYSRREELDGTQLFTDPIAPCGRRVGG